MAEEGQLSRQWHLVRRPRGVPSGEDVELVTAELPPLGPDEVLVRNHVMSVEPYMRGRMSETRSYVEPFELGAAMNGPAVGRVVASRSADLPVGAWVHHDLGWRDVAVVRAAGAKVIDVEAIPPSAYLGALGLTGFTAYVGLLRIGDCRPGDTVFVSAAAGAVGSMVGQIASARGCTVIGSAGSAEKVGLLTGELGFDAAFDYHGSIRDRLNDALERAGVAGIDVYFDNVGGPQLEAAIRRMNEGGRIVLCGAISTYNATEPVPGPRNLLLMIWRRLRMEGFLAGDHESERPAFEKEMAAWLAGGAVRSVERVLGEGIEQAWPAFLAMLDGGNVGKALVRLETS